MNVHVPFAAAMVCGRGRSSGHEKVVVVATGAMNFDSGALVVLVVTVVGAEVSCDTRFTVGDLTRAHALLQVSFSAAMMCGHGRDRVCVGGCSRNNGQSFWLRRWLSLTVIDNRYRRFAKGILPQEHAPLHIQVPTGQWVVCEFGMNAAVCVCGLLLLLLRFNIKYIWYWYFKNTTKTSTRRLGRIKP
jgi:hypothetical protein